MTFKKMLFNSNLLGDIEWVATGSVEATGPSINFTGEGKVSGFPDINMMGDEFKIDIKTSDNIYTDVYQPKAFIHIQFLYIGGKVFKGTYPIIGDVVTVNPEVSEMGDMNSKIGQYPITNFNITIESKHPLNISSARVYKSTRDAVVESEGGITQNPDGSYDIGENVTSSGGGGGGVGGGDLDELWDAINSHSKQMIVDNNYFMRVDEQYPGEGSEIIDVRHTPYNNSTEVTLSADKIRPFTVGYGDLLSHLELFNYGNEIQGNRQIGVKLSGGNSQDPLWGGINFLKDDVRIPSLQSDHLSPKQIVPQNETSEILGEHFGPGGDGEGTFGWSSGIEIEYRSYIPVNHTTFDASNPELPDMSANGYVDGYVITMKHHRRPNYTDGQSGDSVQVGDFVNPLTNQPPWTPPGSYGDGGPRIIKYLFANDYRVYITSGEGTPNQEQMFFLLSDFPNLFQELRGYQIGASEPTGSGSAIPTDGDFSGTRNGSFRYIGSSKTVRIPHVIKGVRVTSYRGMFENTEVSKVISNNRSVTDMAEMFKGNTSYVLDVSELDTFNVKYMRGMFDNTNAYTLDLSNFDTSQVTDMYSMFAGSNATEIILSSFDTRKVRDMGWMFANAKVSPVFIRTFDMDPFKTNVYGMFSGAKASVVYVKDKAVADYLNSQVTEDISFEY